MYISVDIVTMITKYIGNFTV